MKAKLTVRTVEAVKPASVDVIVWDSELTNFGLKVTPKGRRTYFLYYRTKDGEQRRPSIGVHGPVRPEAARAIARRWLADVAEGRDPSRIRSSERAAATVRELADRYLTEHARTRKKATSVRNDERLIKRHIVPVLGARKIQSVTRADIAGIHHSLRETPYEANRFLALASKMFALAERWGLRSDGSNPAKNIDRYPEHKRERYLSKAEFARLWAVLGSDNARDQVSPSALTAIKLLMLTGRRLTEVLTMRWEWLDLDARVLRLPDSKSGALVVSLGGAAVEVLIWWKETVGSTGYVIPGQRTGKPLVNLQKPWRLIRDLAALPDVRLHDLRHTFASVGAGLGMSLPLLGRLLGHSQAATTSRYAHLSQDPVRVAADAIGAQFMNMISAETPVPTSS